MRVFSTLRLLGVSPATTNASFKTVASWARMISPRSTIPLPVHAISRFKSLKPMELIFNRYCPLNAPRIRKDPSSPVMAPATVFPADSSTTAA